MKTLIALTFLLALGTAQASECEQYFPNEKDVYECVSIDPEPSIITENRRIIFISQLVCLDKKPNSVRFTFLHPGQYNDEIKLLSDNENGFKGYESRGVYPSGNVINRYSDVQTIELSNKDNQITMKYRRHDKHVFKKDQLRGTGNYFCIKIK